MPLPAQGCLFVQLATRASLYGLPPPIGFNHVVFNGCVMFEKLVEADFEVIIKNHAGAIFDVDFSKEADELVAALLDFQIPVEELIGSGGGEAKSTQRLRRRLYEADWQKHNFEFRSYIDDIEQTAISHEIDHVRRGEAGTIALEIEWNNKDPFFDRDLENFQRLHAQSVISLGSIITRGTSLQDALIGIVERCLIKHEVLDEDGLKVFQMHERTARQRKIVETNMKRHNISYAEAFAKQFVSDKFGQATTHWRKLEDRIGRGVGNPCPLLLIGIPASIIVE